VIKHRRTVAKTDLDACSDGHARTYVTTGVEQKDHEGLDPEQAAELAAWWLQAFEAPNRTARLG
jgi:hypothetical protein